MASSWARASTAALSVCWASSSSRSPAASAAVFFFDLHLERGYFGLVFGDQVRFLGHVALHGLAEGLQLGDGGLGGAAGRLDGGGLQAQAGHLVRRLLPAGGNGGLLRVERRFLCCARADWASVCCRSWSLRVWSLPSLAAGAGGEAGKLGFEILQVLLDRRGQELDLLGFLGAAQDFVLRFAEATLDGGDLKLGLRGERGGFGCLLAKGLGAGGECFAFFREARERIGAGQHARAFWRRSHRSCCRPRS